MLSGKHGGTVAYDPKTDDRWTYLVSGFMPGDNELVSVMAGNPITAEFIAEIFRREGMTKVAWRNTVDS
jgi:hypothetical protein